MKRVTHDTVRRKRGESNCSTLHPPLHPLYLCILHSSQFPLQLNSPFQIHSPHHFPPRTGPKATTVTRMATPVAPCLSPLTPDEDTWVQNQNGSTLGIRPAVWEVPDSCRRLNEQRRALGHLSLQPRITKGRMFPTSPLRKETATEINPT